MSHLATLNMLVKDLTLVAQIAQEKGWGFEAQIKARQSFAGVTKEGSALQIPGWKYPIIITEQGDLLYDHYNGNWGNPVQLQEFVHEYTTQLNLQDLQMAGMSAYVTETSVNEAHQIVTRVCFS